jgi:hypothetical protein
MLERTGNASHQALPVLLLFVIPAYDQKDHIARGSAQGTTPTARQTRDWYHRMPLGVTIQPFYAIVRRKIKSTMPQQAGNIPHAMPMKRINFSVVGCSIKS